MKKQLYCVRRLTGKPGNISPAITEAAPAFAILGGKASAEAGLARVGLQMVAKKYWRPLLGSTLINAMQNGANPSQIDGFDIATNTLNPYRSFAGLAFTNLLNSTIDYNPFALGGNQLKTLGNGKNVFQAGLDFSFGMFGEGFKYTFNTLGGSQSWTELFTDIITGNTGGQVQKLAEDK